MGGGCDVGFPDSLCVSEEVDIALHMASTMGY